MDFIVIAPKPNKPTDFTIKDGKVYINIYSNVSLDELGPDVKLLDTLSQSMPE